MEPLPEPPEPEVETIEKFEPPPVVKRKKRKKRTPTPKPEPVVETPEPVQEPELIETPEAVEELVDPEEEPEPVQVDLGDYGRSLHSAVQRKQRYPRAARMMRMEGTVEVEIRIDAKGNLVSEPTVATSSGHDLLDKEALRMVRVAAPYSTLPDGFIGQSALFKVPVRFELVR